MSNSGGNGGNGPVYAGVPPGQTLPPMTPINPYQPTLPGAGAHTHSISIPKKQYFKANIVRHDGKTINIGAFDDIIAEYFEFKDGVLYGHTNLQNGMYVGGGNLTRNTLSSVTPVHQDLFVRIVPLDEDNNYKENLLRAEGDDLQAIKNFVGMIGGGDGSKA